MTIFLGREISKMCNETYRHVQSIQFDSFIILDFFFNLLQIYWKHIQKLKEILCLYEPKIYTQNKEKDLSKITIVVKTYYLQRIHKRTDEPPREWGLPLFSPCTLSAGIYVGLQCVGPLNNCIAEQTKVQTLIPYL